MTWASVVVKTRASGVKKSISPGVEMTWASGVVMTLCKDHIVVYSASQYGCVDNSRKLVRNLNKAG